MMGPGCPMPGNGMSITISIDLGDFLGGPPCSPEPEECDDDKLTYFNEANRPKRSGFREAVGNAAEKLGHRPEKPKPFEDKSFSDEDEEDKKKKEDKEEKFLK